MWKTLVMILLATGWAAAGELGFGGMEIYRLDRGASDLHVHDLNHDGRDDVIFVNNAVSRLEILLRLTNEPPPEVGYVPLLDETFINRGVVIDQNVIAAQVARLTAAPHAAILLMGRETGLTIYEFIADTLQAPRAVYLRNTDRLMDFQVADLNGNGFNDIVVCRKDNLEILWNDGQGLFGNRTEMRITPPDALKVEAADFTGNGHVDLLLFIASTPTVLRLRPGMGRGEFGPEHLLAVPSARRIAALRFKDDTARIGSIIQNGRGMRIYALSPAPAGDLFAHDEIMPRRIPLQAVSPRHPPAWIVADFTANGHDDVCIAAPELGQMHVYAGTDDGLTAIPQTFASLAGVNAVSLTAAGDLLVFSAGEKTAALHMRDDPGAFPRLLPPPAGRTPLLAAAHPGRDAYFWVTRDPATRQAFLSEHAPDSNEIVAGALPLDLPNDPEALRTSALPDGAVALMFFIPFQPPVVYHYSDASALELLPAANFNPAAMTLRPAMAAAAASGRVVFSFDKVAREFEWQAGLLHPLRQFTPGTESARLAAVTPFTLGADAGMVFFDQGANDLLWFGPDAGRPLRLHVAFPVTAPAGLHRLRDQQGRADAGMVMITDTELFVFHNRADAFTAVAAGEYTSPAEEPSLADYRLLRLGQPAQDVLVLTDTRNRALEFVTFDNRRMDLRLGFEVFHDPGFNRAARAGMEPRQAAAGDINGDGIGDLLLLAHDKLIIYRGE